MEVAKDNRSRRAIPYGRQHITDEDIAEVSKTLRSDFLTQGPMISEFENEFAEYVGSKYAVAVANGTAALHLCAMALNVVPGNKVLTTPISFAASANCVLYCGGEIDFVDIDPKTALMDLDKLEAKLDNSSPGTYAGIVPVHFAGATVNLERLRLIAERHNLWILEDACHAPGGTFQGEDGTSYNCGGNPFSDCAIFSFHPVKHVACGEGGMITTNSPEIRDKIQLLRTHGITKDPSLLSENHGGWYYEMQELGYNYRLSDIHAALGVSQLRRADSGLQRRRALADTYDRAFSGTAVRPLGPQNRTGHAFHLYVVRVPERKALYDHLRSQQIFAQVHYIPIHLQPHYQKSGFRCGDFPNAEEYYEGCLSLPMYPTLTDEEQEYVIENILAFTDS